MRGGNSNTVDLYIRRRGQPLGAPGSQTANAAGTHDGNVSFRTYPLIFFFFYVSLFYFVFSLSLTIKASFPSSALFYSP